MKVVDPRHDPACIHQYVALRNRYADLLNTQIVTTESTTLWLAAGGVEVRCLVEKKKVEGAVVLYMNRDGEVAFFADKPGKGLGTKLLDVVEKVAAEKGLRELWAWTRAENDRAKGSFLKAGFWSAGEEDRASGNVRIAGCLFRKSVGKGGGHE